MCVCELVKLIEAFLESKKEHVGGVFLLFLIFPDKLLVSSHTLSLIIVF